MSTYPAMSQSNLNYFLGLMGGAPYNLEINQFGAWDAVAFFVSNSSDPENPQFKLVPVFGTVPEMEVKPPGN